MQETFVLPRHLPAAGCLFVSVTVSTQPSLVLPLGDDVFEELVDRPADGGGGHLVDDPGLDAFKEGRHATHPVHGPKSLAKARDVAAACG